MSEFSTSAKKPYGGLKYSQTDFPYDARYQSGPYFNGSYYAGDLARPQAQSWVEQIPVEKRYIDWVEQQRIDLVPVEKTAVDHIEIEHRKEFMPVPRLEKRTEWIPVDKYDEKVDYVPYETSYVTKGSGLHSSGMYSSGLNSYADYGYRSRPYSGYGSSYSSYGYGYPNYYSYSSYSPYSRGGYGSSYGGYGSSYGGYGSSYNSYGGPYGSRYSRPHRYY